MCFRDSGVLSGTRGQPAADAPAGRRGQSGTTHEHSAVPDSHDQANVGRGDAAVWRPGPDSLVDAERRAAGTGSLGLHGLLRRVRERDSAGWRVCPVYETGSERPTLTLVKPAINNTRVDMSPCGQSVLRMLLMLYRRSTSRRHNDIGGGRREDTGVPVGRVVRSEGGWPGSQGVDTVRAAGLHRLSEGHVYRGYDTGFAPVLRTDAQAKTLRTALQILGDLCGFGITYFNFDGTGYVKTATEVPSDNSALMRIIRRYEHVLEKAVVGICRAAMAASRLLGVPPPDEGDMRVNFDDGIITDTAAEKQQNMVEVAAGLMKVVEYRPKWHGDSDKRPDDSIKMHHPDAVSNQAT